MPRIDKKKKNDLSRLAYLRAKVLAFDKRLIGLLKLRFDLTNEIQKIKKSLGLNKTQHNREKELLNHHKNFGRKMNFSSVFIGRLFKLLFSYSKKTGKIK